MGVPLIIFFKKLDIPPNYQFFRLFLPIYRKLLGIFFKLVHILLEHVSRYVKKLKKITFFKNCRQNGGWFFFHFFKHWFANFSKTTWYFFLIVFGPHRRLFKTSSAKKSKKTKNFKYAKNHLKTQFWAIFRHFFDSLNTNSQISRKQLDIFFWLFLVPSEDFLRHLLRKN